MDRDQMWCERCERAVGVTQRVNYPMTVGILSVLVGISVVFVFVTFLDRSFGTPETVLLTMLVTVVPFAYMRLRRMRAVIRRCALCGSESLKRLESEEPVELVQPAPQPHLKRL
ncbi:MAG TPA: hypothetical protein VF960_06980 [Chloroflexota bacterium]